MPKSKKSIEKKPISGTKVGKVPKSRISTKKPKI